jgi:proteasome lid subunit RPN8/RPN11
MKSRLEIDRQLVEELVREALVSEGEICGFLLGSVEGERFRAHELYKAKNVSSTKDISFDVDPRSVYEAHAYAEKKGLDVVGIYHSHPGPPSPSTTDLKFMKEWPVAWLIISSIDGSMAAYIVKQSSIEELEIQLT